MSDLICISCAEEHTGIDLEEKDYPAFVGKCLFCDGVKVGIDYLSSLREGE